MEKSSDKNLELIIEEPEYKELTVSEIKGQVYRLNGMLCRIEGKIDQAKRFLEVTRSVSERTQKLVNMGVSLYDLESTHHLRI